MAENKNDARGRQSSVYGSIRRPIVFVALAVAAVLYGPPAYAKTVFLSGTHSKDQVNRACDGVGGIKNQGPDGHGYGCYNPNNGVLVACTDAGECTGFIPRKAK